jgi:poly(3-hydroxybutyrate) depolymerase
MGHPAASAAAANLVGEPYANLDASRAIWSFLAAHPRV